MHSGTLSDISPSFATHSSNNLADVAARVVREFRHENGSDEYADIFNLNDYNYDSVPSCDIHNNDNNNSNNNNNDEDEDEDEDFEFAVVCTDVNSDSISVNDVSLQYPLFDRSLLLEMDPNSINVVNNSSNQTAVRLPLRKLFSEDRDFGSSSSSESDDLDGIAPGTYCIWKPKTESPERCKKSNSTGNSSRRWKFRDILYRSNSDGKETPFLFFKPLIASNKVKKVEKGTKIVTSSAGDGENKAENGAYLPSGRTLFDAITTVSRSNRSLHPF